MFFDLTKVIKKMINTHSDIVIISIFANKLIKNKI